MGYGEMIRSARKALKLNQSDMSNENISRTLISEIEKENINLVPSKAFLIYKKLIIESCSQDVEVEINFDELLGDNINYVQLKQAKDILDRLKGSIKTNDPIQQFELENIRLFALRHDIGILKYYIFKALARLSTKNVEFHVKVLFNALEFLKWEKFENIYEEYDQTLKEVTQNAYKNRMAKELIYFYEFQKERLIEMGIPVESRIYYNLSIFYEHSGDIKKAYNYIVKYLEYKSMLNSDDYYDALLSQARLSTKSGKYAEGISYYEELLSIFGSNKSKKSFVLSNILYNIPKLDYDYDLEKIKSYVEELVSLLPKIIETRDFEYIPFVNLAIGYDLLDNYLMSTQYLEQALFYAHTDDSKANIIIDSLNYIKCIDYNFLVNTIITVKINKMNPKILPSYLKILLQFQAVLFEKNYFDQIKILNNYIKDYIGGITL